MDFFLLRKEDDGRGDDLHDLRLLLPGEEIARFQSPHLMNLATFTLVHILISLAGITTGLIAVGAWLGGKALAVKA